MLIQFNDNCEIFRKTGVNDEWDNEVVDTIYTGPCLYQEKTSVRYSDGMVTRTPLIFLRGSGTLIQINDIVRVVTSEGREEESVVKLVRDIEIGGNKYERIELKQNQGD